MLMWSHRRTEYEMLPRMFLLSYLQHDIMLCHHWNIRNMLIKKDLIYSDINFKIIYSQLNTDSVYIHT